MIGQMLPPRLTRNTYAPAHSRSRAGPSSRWSAAGVQTLHCSPPAVLQHHAGIEPARAPLLPVFSCSIFLGCFLWSRQIGKPTGCMRTPCPLLPSQPIECENSSCARFMLDSDTRTLYTPLSLTHTQTAAAAWGGQQGRRQEAHRLPRASPSFLLFQRDAPTPHLNAPTPALTLHYSHSRAHSSSRVVSKTVARRSSNRILSSSRAFSCSSLRARCRCVTLKLSLSAGH